MTGTNTFTNTDLVATIEEFWTPMVLEEFFASTVAANHFTDLSQFQRTGNDIYHVPDVYTNAFSVQTQSTQGTEVTLDSPTQVDVTLTVNNHVYIAYIIDDLARAQISSSYDIWSIYSKKAASTLANDLEADLFALWSGLSQAVGVTTTGALTDAHIRSGIRTLAANNIPMTGGETSFFFHPFTYYDQLLGVQKYYDQSQFSNRVPGVVRTGNFGEFNAERGYMGDLYGMPIYVSTNVVNSANIYRNMLAHKTALAFAVQTPNGGVRTRAQEWLANLGVLTTHDLIDGVVELRDAAAVVLKGDDATAV